MQAIEFPQQTDVLAKNQPQYIPLPVFVLPGERTIKDEAGNITKEAVAYEMTACFLLDPEEIAEINATSKLWYTQCVFGNPFQPVRMSTRNPFEKVRGKGFSPITALVSALKNDPGYRESWQANIAMAFVDTFNSFMGKYGRNEAIAGVHAVANEAAANFLNSLCSA